VENLKRYEGIEGKNYSKTERYIELDRKESKKM
jgi:hypothetical protein